MPLSTIFQFTDKSTDLPEVTDKLDHIKLYKTI
jgi:hypothetical protein